VERHHCEPSSPDEGEAIQGLETLSSPWIASSLLLLAMTVRVASPPGVEVRIVRAIILVGVGDLIRWGYPG
jgi:hypothetical protein